MGSGEGILSCDREAGTILLASARGVKLRCKQKQEEERENEESGDGRAGEMGWRRREEGREKGGGRKEGGGKGRKEAKEGEREALTRIQYRL